MKSLIVSLHDVSPHTFAASREILRDLAEVGVSVTSLLVIPNHHQRGHFLSNPTFCTWLEEMEEAGHEIVTHGYFHQRERNASESTRDKMITRFYTAGEGEFFDITETDALEKLQRAQAEFAQIHLHPVGFIAPAWLLSKGGESAARKAGFQYTTTLGEIRVLGAGSFPPASLGVLPGEPPVLGGTPTLPGIYRSQSLVYSVRSGWRRACSMVWNPFLARRLAENPVVRLGIHPPDWQHPNIRRQILSLVRNLEADRKTSTYESFLTLK